MIRRLRLIAALATLAGVSIVTTIPESRVDAQAAQPAERGGLQTLRRQVERRFEPFPLVDGFALRPKQPMRGVRSIEVTGGTIAVDGSAVTGAELRRRIGDDADLVIQLSYLDAADRKALFADAPAAGAVPTPEPRSAPTMAERPDGVTAPDARSSDRRNRLDWPGDNRVHLGGDVNVGPDEVVQGDVVAIGGSVHVDGVVHGDVAAVGGDVQLGPHAVVDDDVAVLGGSLERADGARVGGRVKRIGIGSFSGNWIRPRNWMSGWVNRGLGTTFALMSTIARGAVLCLLAGLVVLLAGTYVDQISVRAATEPVKAGAIGLLAQALFLPLLIITILVLVVTIVGIPLLVLIPFVILGLGVVGLVGFTAVAHRLGDHVGRRLGWTHAGAYANTVAGIAVILFPVLIARLALLVGGTGVTVLWHLLAAFGVLVEYLAWTVGFGAVALVRFGKKSVVAGG